MKHTSILVKGAALAATISLFGCAEIGVNKLRNTVPQGSEFTKALAGEYLKFAESEYKIHNDDWSSWQFAKKGQDAAAGKEVEPEDPKKYDLPEAAQNEIMHSRNRLLHALNAGGKTMYPVEAAKAQVMYDCWIEQQEENFQFNDINGCRDGFYKYVRSIELRLDQKNPKFDAVLTHRPTHSVYFKLGSAFVDKDSSKVIQEVAELYKKFKSQDQDIRLFVYGHTDKVGSVKANDKLSVARAANVAKALIKAGVDKNAIDNEGKGLIEGPLKEPHNRRVDIQIDVK